MTAARIRVLLVEDDDDNRELMGEVLTSSGFAVASAASGEEALLRLDAGPSVDVVVTDVGMPGMGGLELARASKERAPGVPVVVVTGWAERDDIARARGHEVDAVLVKPVDPDALTEAVRLVVGR